MGQKNIFLLLLSFLLLESTFGQFDDQELQFRGPDFDIRVFPPTVKGLVDEKLNLTLTLTCHPLSLCGDKARIYLEVADSPYFHFWTDNDSDNGYDNDNDNDNGNDNEKEDGVDLEEGSETIIFFKTSMIGIYDIQLYTLLADGTKEYLQTQDEEETLQVVVGRPLQHDQAVTLVLLILLLLAMFLMGIEIDLRVILEHLRRPVGPLIGFVSQFLFMPLLSWGAGRLLLLHKYERLGLVVVGATPGGVHSNLWTSIAGGDVNLSVTMTFLSTLASFGMTTLWIWLLNEDDHTIHIPYDNIAVSLATFTIPLLLGCLFRHCKPDWADKALRLLYRPFGLACLVVFPVAVILGNVYYFYLVTWRHLAAGVMVGSCGFLSGGLLAWVFGLGTPQILAVTLETAIQNPFVALVIMMLSFPSPYCEMGLLSVFSFLFPVAIFLFCIYAVWVMVSGCRRVLGVMKEVEERERDERELETVGQEMLGGPEVPA